MMNWSDYEQEELESKARRKLWALTRASAEFKKFREGGSGLNGINVEKTKELMDDLGLPWDESEPFTVDRMSWLMVMLADHPIEILRFLRDVCGITETMNEEYNLGMISQRGELGDENQVVIIDVGTQFTKVGWAGDNMPTCAFPSLNKEGKPVMERGVVIDFDGYDELIKTSFTKLNTTPSAQTCFIIVAPKTPQHHKERIAKFLFEELNIPNLFMCTSSYAALCSTDKLSSLVITLGAGICHVVPIYEATVIQHAIQRLDIAGQDINDFLSKKMNEAGVEKKKLTKKRVEETKRYKCVVPNTYNKETFQMYESPEIIFSPSIIQREVPSLHALILKCITQCDIDTRKSLWENIIICGGSTQFKGFVPRLEAEIRKLCPETIEPKVIAPKNRLVTVHQGASNMCFWTEFGDWIISKDEWAIDGIENLTLKCLN